MMTGGPYTNYSLNSHIHNVSLQVILVFFNDAATTEIYTLSLHDALPIYFGLRDLLGPDRLANCIQGQTVDRKSTRLNSSHRCISYAVFCLKKQLAARLTCGGMQLRFSLRAALRTNPCQ